MQAIGIDNWGNSTAGTSIFTLAAPPPPTGLTATAGHRTVALAWTNDNSASSYSLARATTSNGTCTTIATGISGTPAARMLWA